MGEERNRNSSSIKMISLSSSLPLRNMLWKLKTLMSQSCHAVMAKIKQSKASQAMGV